MNKQIFTALAVFFSLIILIWTGCKKDTGPDTVQFIIQIDSIVHPDTINFGEDLSIKFYGLIGTDGCHSFDRFEPEYTQGELAVTSWGVRIIDEACTQQMVYMNGSTLLVSDVPAGNLIIKAIQPDGSSIIQSVFVKE
ncbi:MAG: hypothetical protein H8E34_10345 [Bacteroidetes bacterium]|nr:hypothetical protein [Bacteroidota bacterium]MBL6944065.1 hypothetical protein [Bacteroidales bacterium]